MAYEKMSCHYDTEKDLIDRLHNTICRFNEVPVLVSVRSVRELSLHDPCTLVEIGRINPKQEGFDISSPELGYANIQLDNGKTEVKWIERTPTRRFRQGLSSDVCKIVDMNGLSSGPMSGHYLKNNGIMNMIMNKYPSYEDVLNPDSSFIGEIAVSKNVALSRAEFGLVLVNINLETVGFIIPEDGPGVRLKESGTSWVIHEELEKVGLSGSSRRERIKLWP